MSLRSGTQASPSLSDTFKASVDSRPSRRRKRPAPLSVRLNPQERAKLEALAGETPLTTYIKFRLFNGLPDLATYKLRPSSSRQVTDTKLIAKLLAALGESRLANNLNQLAKAVNMGTLDVSSGTEKELLAACAEVHAMRRDLIRALGLKDCGE